MPGTGHKLIERVAPCPHVWRIQQYAVHVEDRASEAHDVTPLSPCPAIARAITSAKRTLRTLHGICRNDLSARQVHGGPGPATRMEPRQDTRNDSPATAPRRTNATRRTGHKTRCTPLGRHNNSCVVAA